MLRIKRLYAFIIQTFLPVFFMTFGICLFIVLMQFLWRYVEDLVGKGLDNLVLAELFLYAALQLIPMALPLSLLLASLMAFGNLGERLELLAIKAAGVSLLKTMAPLIILVGCISVSAFFFQNEAMPRIQVKFKALLISIKKKSPELDIPEGSFYSGIKNYSIYVKKKNKETKFLYDVMIYDTSKGFNDMAVFICDSALMRVSEDKQFLMLNLYTGQRFANISQSEINNNNTSGRNHNNNRFVPYSREIFTEKEIIISFNSGFDRMDESNLENTYISKNIVQLSHSIDSLSFKLDSINVQDRQVIGKHTYLTYRNTEAYSSYDSIRQVSNEVQKDTNFPTKIDFDSLLASYSRNEMSQILIAASTNSENLRMNSMESVLKENLQKTIRMHEIERHRKFVLSFACLIFFFIGAPLGAIIRKGGLGMPVVISVLLFIIYYIIDNVGYKLARDAVWEVWQGMWLSSFMLFPLGVFLTYKAMNDSTLFNPESYGKFIRKILRIQSPAKLTESEQAVLLDRIPSISQLDVEPERLSSLQAMDSDKLRDMIRNYTQYGYDESIQTVSLSILKERGAELNDIVNNQSYEFASVNFSNFNKSSIFTATGYLLALVFLIFNITSFSTIIYSAYLIVFIRSMIYYFMFYTGLDKKSVIYHALAMLLALVCYPLLYPFIKKKMEIQLKKLKHSIF